MNNQLYGYANKVLAEMNSHILKHPELIKFLYYTDNKYTTQSILDEELVSASSVYNKNFFVYKKIPNVIEEEGAFMFIDLYRLTPMTLGGKIREITFSIDILVHQNCASTIHGNRAVCILSALEEALTDYTKKYSIGNIDLIRLSPLLGVVTDFCGYSMQFRAYGFKG